MNSSIMGAEGKRREHFMRNFPGLDNINDLFQWGSTMLKNVTLIKLLINPNKTTFSQAREGVKSSDYLNL